MARRLTIEWQDDVNTLFQLYRTESDPELRPRWHGLCLMRQGHAPKDAAQLVGVHVRTIRTWLRWYRAGGTTAMRQHRHGGRQGQPSFLTAAQCTQLKSHAATGAIKTIRQAIVWVETQFGVTYTYWGMRSLFDRLQLPKKVPRPQADNASPEAQAAWKKGGWPPHSPLLE